MKTPDEIVSEQITVALLEKGLITAEDAKSLPGRIAKGEVRDTDWITLLRMGMKKPQPAKEGKAEA